MIKHYVFDDLATATAAEAYIRIVGQLPLVGVNAATGEPNENATSTTEWATPRQRLDGKWTFERIPQNILNQFPPSVANYFDTSFPNVVEDYDINWFNLEE